MRGVGASRQYREVCIRDRAPELFSLGPRVSPILIAPDHQGLSTNGIQSFQPGPRLHGIKTREYGRKAALFGNLGAGFEGRGSLPVQKPRCGNAARGCPGTVSFGPRSRRLYGFEPTGQNPGYPSPVEYKPINLLRKPGRDFLRDHTSHGMAQKMKAANSLRRDSFYNPLSESRDTGDWRKRCVTAKSWQIHSDCVQ